MGELADRLRLLAIAVFYSPAHVRGGIQGAMRAHEPAYVSLEPAPPAGHPVLGAGQFGSLAVSRGPRAEMPEDTADPAETRRMGVARRERPMPGVRTPVAIILLGSDTTAEDREGWLMPPDAIGGLRDAIPCPTCHITYQHPVIGANGDKVWVSCDSEACPAEWTIPA